MITTARDYRQGAQAALARQDAANALLIDLLSAQSANRAYILLAQGPDLRAYTGARDRYPDELARLRAVLGGSDVLNQSADAVDRTANLWFSEAGELTRPRRKGTAEEPRRRINQGLSENRFNAFRAEHTRLLEEIDEVRVTSLADSDRRRRLTFYAIVAAALLTLLMVAITSRQLWRRVG